MKKFILFLLIILSSINFTSSKGAGVNTPFEDYYPLFPRFQYWTDENDDIIPFAMSFEQALDTGEVSYKIDIEQMDLNGNVINLLKTFHIDPEYSVLLDTYIDSIFYDWSSATVLSAITRNEPVFFRIVYNGSVVLYTGGVMLRPEFVNYESLKVEFGDYVYNGSGLVDSDDQTQFTYDLTNDSVIIIH